MMNRLEAAARQALEALEDLQKYGVKQTRALFALREALADQQAAEPVGWFESPLGEFRANPRYGITFPSRLLSWQIPLYMQPIVDGDGDDDLTITYMSGLHRGKELALAEQKLREAEQAAPTQQPLTDEQKAVLRECRNQAMKWAAQAGIPECGAFGGMAQDLDWLCGQLGIAGSKT